MRSIARDTNLKRDVALKALPPALADDADRLARLQREAEVLASLNHPNIGQDDAVMAVAVESGSEFSFAAPERLFSGLGSGVRGYDVARDGRFVMILPGDESREAAAPASIVVVQNFGEELKQRVRPSGN